MFYSELVGIEARECNLRSYWRTLRRGFDPIPLDEKTLHEELREDRDNDFRDRIVRDARRMRYARGK